MSTAVASPAPRLARRAGFIAAPLVVVVLVVGALLAAHSSTASIGPDGAGLARLRIGSLGGAVTDIHAVTAKGHTVTLQRVGDVLTPTRQLPMGESVRIEATVTRPSWVGWALGSTERKTITVTTPKVAVTSRWVDAAAGQVRVAFTGSVSRVAYIVAHQTSERKLTTPASTVAIGSHGQAGSLEIAASARPWERLGRPTTVDWFPKSGMPVAIVSPKPGVSRAPSQPIRLIFSRPVASVLAHGHPSLEPATPGTWTQPDSHTLLFTPSGYGTGFGQTLKLKLPRQLDVAAADGSGLHATREVSYTSQPGSTLRLQQLLAEQGYLPLEWTPSGSAVPRTKAAQARAATTAPAGSFHWRYAHTPSELVRQWQPGQVDVITRGALMMFQNDHQLAVDAAAGPGVWKALLDDAVRGARRSDGYSYVYVHRNLPQRLVLWHNGKTVLSSPGNTGIPAAPTQLGTFPVFEHLPVTTMSGTNPDGSKYNDPGIKWVSYFNGGDALHTFNRASFGTPQSLGCVELPETTAQRLFPYTPIGTLVTIED